MSEFSAELEKELQEIRDFMKAHDSGKFTGENVMCHEDGSPNVQSLQDAWQIGRLQYMGGGLPQDYYTAGKAKTAVNRQEAMSRAAMCIFRGAELGISPMHCCGAMLLVRGIWRLWGDAPLALVKKRDDYVDVIEEQIGPKQDISQDGLAQFDPEFGYRCTAKRLDREDVVFEFTYHDAKMAKIIERTWFTHFALMIRYKSRNFALRQQWPDAFQGFNLEAGINREMTQELVNHEEAEPESSGIEVTGEPVTDSDDLNDRIEKSLGINGETETPDEEKEEIEEGDTTKKKPPAKKKSPAKKKTSNKKKTTSKDDGRRLARLGAKEYNLADPDERAAYDKAWEDVKRYHDSDESSDDDCPFEPDENKTSEPEQSSKKEKGSKKKPEGLLF
jgi:hypothetical protein